MTDHSDTWYSRSGSTAKRRALLRGSTQAEICVIGGGLAGIATAFDLATRGRSVVLLERHCIAWGASGRNGGFVTPGFPIGAPELVARVGLPTARELYDLSRSAHSQVRAWIDEFHIDCDPVDGAVRCALSESRESLKAYRDQMERDFSLAYEYWPVARTAEALSSPRYSDAIFNPYTFAIDPLAFTRELATAAEDRGVRIFERSPATALISGRNARGVSTPEGEVRADHVVLAGGGYIDGLHRRTGLAIVPIATFVMVTEPLGERLRKAIRVPYAISDISMATNYYRPLQDGRLLWGGRVQAWEPSARRIAQLLLRDIAIFYPMLAGVRAEIAWSGLMPYLRHRMPMVGRIGEGLWVATGFGGLGMALTTMAGQMVGAGIDEGNDRWRLLSRFGLPFAGGGFGRIPAQLTYWRYATEARFRNFWTARVKSNTQNGR